MSECAIKASQASGGTVSEKEADEGLKRLIRMAQAMSEMTGDSLDVALDALSKKLEEHAAFVKAGKERNVLLGALARERMLKRIRSFPTTIGEGLRAVLGGSQLRGWASRRSVDAVIRAIHREYVGLLINGLKTRDVLDDFLRADAELERAIYNEMEFIGTKKAGSTENETAKKIAEVLKDLWTRMLARENKAGAFKAEAPFYVDRQTHDADRIRRLGGIGAGPEVKRRSYQAWKAIVEGKLDPVWTFRGEDPELFLQRVHDALYSGIHFSAPEEGVEIPPGVFESHAARVSRERILWFKTANDAFEYNQQVGVRDLKSQVFADILFRARSIGLMEELGPNPEATFNTLKLHAGDIARKSGSLKDIKSLEDWRIDALWNLVTGKADIPKSFTLAKVTAALGALAVLPRMGKVLISSLPDQIFMGSEMLHQGFSMLDKLVAHWKSIFGTSKEMRETLYLMGVGLEGIIGDVASRYTAMTTVTGRLHWATQKLFKYNGMNMWTDFHKSAMAEMMSAHLGLYADSTWNNVPEDLRHLLNQYAIGEPEWEIIRKTAWTRKGRKYISPEKVEDREIQTSLRAYFIDRVDTAIPTPDAGVRIYQTGGGLQVGTPAGDAARLIMRLKAFPITVLTRVLAREIYGRGNRSFREFLLHDHRGKWRVAQLIFLTTLAGYLSGAIKDILSGRTPKKIVQEDRDGNLKINHKVILAAMAQGGGVGIMGDYLFAEYDREYRTILSAVAGPTFAQLDPLAEIYGHYRTGILEADVERLKKGGVRTVKFAQDNFPFINMFYTKPILDYFVLWNLQEWLSPGSMERRIRAIEKEGYQRQFIEPMTGRD